MGYRLDYSVSGGVLMVTISGSCPTPGAIARDIGREARENAVRNVLVDVRRLQDRIGKIRDLLAEQDGPKRIAVLDNVLNERLYVFAEIDVINMQLSFFNFHVDWNNPANTTFTRYWPRGPG